MIDRLLIEVLLRAATARRIWAKVVEESEIGAVGELVAPEVVIQTPVILVSAGRARQKEGSILKIGNSVQAGADLPTAYLIGVRAREG